MLQAHPIAADIARVVLQRGKDPKKSLLCMSASPPHLRLSLPPTTPQGHRRPQHGEIISHQLPARQLRFVPRRRSRRCARNHARHLNVPYIKGDVLVLGCSAFALHSVTQVTQVPVTSDLYHRHPWNHDAQRDAVVRCCCPCRCGLHQHRPHRCSQRCRVLSQAHES